MFKKIILTGVFGFIAITSYSVNAENFPTFDMSQPSPDIQQDQIISAVYTFGDGGDTGGSPSNFRAVVFQEVGHPLNSSNQCDILINGTPIGLGNEVNIQPGDTYQFKIIGLDNDPVVGFDNYFCYLGLKMITPGGDMISPGAGVEFGFYDGYSYPTPPTPPTPTIPSNFKLDQTFLNDFRDAQINSSKNGINNGLSISTTVTGSLTLLAFIVISLSIFLGIVIYIVNKRKNTF